MEKKELKNFKIIFVTGGVVSSLGKGVLSASLGKLLLDDSLKVNIMKCDPYLNVDPGTMSPVEHGEVFVTEDGGETDLDLGHYERFMNINLSKNSSLTSGKIYDRLLKNERSGKHLGKTVQIIPHVTNEINEDIIKNAKGYDVLIVEIGGTVGDIETLPFLESIRQLKFEYGEKILLVHIVYIPYLKTNNELKTKPAQKSVKELQSLGVNPDFLVTRNEINLNDKIKSKLSLFTNVKNENIFDLVDLDSIYKIPLYLKELKFDNKIIKKMNLKVKNSNYSDLYKIEKKMKNLKYEINIGVVGKYSDLIDSYKSVIESLKHSSIDQSAKINIKIIDAKSDNEKIIEELKKMDGIVISGGFGKSGIDGKLQAIKYGRENDIPTLGICLGFQLMILEFARNYLNMDVYHGEINPEKENKIIDIMEDQNLNNLGGTQRLGSYECKIANKNSLAYKLYKKQKIFERHRHRYEFNNDFKKQIEDGGLFFSGINTERNLMEIVEYPEKKFFIGTQFHPEFTSRFISPNPIFLGFIKSVIKEKTK